MTYLAVFLLVFASASATSECLQYEPAIVSLAGRLQSQTFPGPPNYESIEAGDAAERALLLKVDKAICVAADPSSELNSQSEHDLTLVQVAAVDDAVRIAAGQLIGKRVRVAGSLFHALTGHHRTPVFIWASSIRQDESGEPIRAPNPR